MRTKYRILIADMEASFRHILAESLNAEEDMQVVGETDDGEKLLELIRDDQPDLVVMDVVLHSRDGIEALDGLLTLPLTRRPRVIILSGFTRSGIARLAAEKGADYCLVKPCQMDTVCERIRQLMAPAPPRPDNGRNKSLEMIVSSTIHELGMPAHVKGYQYIREAILLSVSDMRLLSAVTKELYPMVARRFGTTPGRVERAIRHAIEIAWDRGDLDVLQQYFGYTVSYSKGRPTNSEFIAMVADHLQLSHRELCSGYNVR
ncbi:MAG: sporulation transcription factor Spo0A [Bacillota bacterium]|nr:sporulation transcription factor Spo0A [Bacillota bacterium]